MTISPPRLAAALLLCALTLPARAQTTATAPAPPRTGDFVHAAEGINVPMFTQVFQRMGEKPAKPIVASTPTPGKPAASMPDSEKVHWRFIVPESYTPDGTWGLLVHVESDSKNTRFPKAWAATLAKHRLIWACAQESGNDQQPIWRITLALEAVNQARSLYKLNDARTYCSGISGGGRVVSRLALVFPDIFTGAISFCGCDYVRGPGAFRAPPDMVRRAMNSRFALFTGTKDFNEAGTKAVLELMRQDGFRYVALIDEPNRDHGLPDNEEWFTKCLEVLDAPLVTQAKPLVETAAKQEKLGQFGAALATYRQALALAPAADFNAQTPDHIASLAAQYQTARAEFLALAAAGDKPKANAAFANLIKVFSPLPPEDAKTLRSAIKP